MINSILSMLGLGDASKTVVQERKHVRRNASRRFFIEVNGKIFPVKDWSEGGVLFEVSDIKNFSIGQKLTLIMGFGFEHDVIKINHTAKIVRAANDSIAASFEPVKNDTKRQFDRVLDGIVSENFIKSQVA